jgi:hypothetical protein
VNAPDHQLALTGDDTSPPQAAQQVPAPREPEPVRPTNVWRISGRPVDTDHDIDDEERQR